MHWKFENPPAQGNWKNSFDAETMLTYHSTDEKNYPGISFFKLERAPQETSEFTFSIHFVSGCKKDQFLEKLGNQVDLFGALRRGSTIKATILMGVVTNNLKTIGLCLKTIHQLLPVDKEDKEKMVKFLSLPENSMDKDCSYNTCSIS